MHGVRKEALHASRHSPQMQLSVFDIQLTSTISILQHAAPSSVYFYNIHCSARLSLSCPWRFVRAAEHPEEHPWEQRIQLSHGPDQRYFPSESPGWANGWGLTGGRYPFIRISECISARVSQLGSNSRSDYWRDVPFYSGMIFLDIDWMLGFNTNRPRTRLLLDRSRRLAYKRHSLCSFPVRLYSGLLTPGGGP